MKREVLIAIFFGLIVGLVLTVGMYRARTALESIPVETPHPLLTTNTEGDPTPTPANSSEIRLSEPVMDAVVEEPTIQITGTTYPDSTLVIIQNEKEVLAVTDSFGNFSVPVTLEIGPNIFVIRVLSTGKAPQELIRTVIYESSKTSPSATTSTGVRPSPTPRP